MRTLLIAIAIFTMGPLFSQYSLTGNVKDGSSGKPVVGATVLLQGTYIAVATNLQGNFTIGNLENRPYDLEVRLLGYEPFELNIPANHNGEISINLKRSPLLGDEVIITGVRADKNTPTAQTELDKADIEEINLGKDLPLLLNQTPNVVVTSDAGNGIGYSGIRIRGSDITRINATVNGIPLNDAESHGVFWVDLPDFASSIQSIQIQRGVGTSTNGAGAFGASINMNTLTLQEKPYAEVANSYGSFNTWKNTVEFGTGLIKRHWAIDGRLSRLTTDGYIDRAFSDLKSFYLSGGYYGDRSTLKALIFSGSETTYQAWYGVPEEKLFGSPDDIEVFVTRYELTGRDAENVRTANPRTYNFKTYENETDNYWQTHYQLLFSRDLSKRFILNTALHYTRGYGYYEQYKQDESFADYGITPAITVVDGDTVTTTDLIRRRWLDNHFYGATASLIYNNQKGLKITAGGAANRYNGLHYGEIIWARYAGQSELGDRYYENDATKTDINGYVKVNFRLSNRLSAYADGQLRKVSYSFSGFDDNLTPAIQHVSHTFINPKGGLRLSIGTGHAVFASYAIAHREPVREDYVASTPSSRPLPEELADIELGYNYSSSKLTVAANLFRMDYINQLVLTGEINDVGAYTRSNVPNSYRQGVELAFQYKPYNWLSWKPNLSYSQNKIESFTEYIDDYDNGGQITNAYTNTDIAYSPAWVAASNITLGELKGLQLDIMTKYVGKQYLDNTMNEDRVLESFLVNDLILSYAYTRFKYIDEVELSIGVYNVLNELYESNGYTFSYQYGGELITENWYYPQAERHFLARIRIRF